MPLILDDSSSSSSPSRHSSSDAKRTPDEAAAAAAALRRHAQHTADVVIVGAGILGSALATTFARQGRSVILLEKSLKEPDRIVGELLQPGGVTALSQLGLLECLDDIDSVPVHGYEVIYHGQRVHIPYPANADPGSETHPKGRATGRSFHHGRFVQRLRNAAMRETNVSVVETTATKLVRSDYTGQVLGVETLTRGEHDYYFGQLTIVAEGYASKLRLDLVAHQPCARSKFWGLELIDAALPRPNHGHVILSDNPPVLLYQIGSHETRALVDIPEGLPSASVAAGGVKGHLQKVVLPSLPPETQPSFAEALEKGKLRSMPNSWLPPSTNSIAGVAVLGDAMNMRHPLTGGGMTVALNDVVLLRELLRPEVVPDLAETRLVLRQLRTFHWRRKNLTSVINILAQALYSLFAANSPRLRVLQEGCFRYFERGGNCIDGPVGLLAGIIRQPLVLVYHFFAVAVLGIQIFAAQHPLWQLPKTIFEGVMVFWSACVVIGPYILSELRS